MPLQSRNLILGGWAGHSQFKKEFGLYQLLLQRRRMKIWVQEEWCAPIPSLCCHLLFDLFSNSSNLVDAYIRSAFTVMKTFFLQEKVDFAVSEACKEAGMWIRLSLTFS